MGLEQQQAVKVWVKANLIAQETGVPLTHRLVESVLGKELPASYRQATRDWQVGQMGLGGVAEAKECVATGAPCECGAALRGNLRGNPNEGRGM